MDSALLLLTLAGWQRTAADRLPPPALLLANASRSLIVRWDGTASPVGQRWVHLTVQRKSQLHQAFHVTKQAKQALVHCLEPIGAVSHPTSWRHPATHRRQLPSSLHLSHPWMLEQADVGAESILWSDLPDDAISCFQVGAADGHNLTEARCVPID
jgi:hypothetical protein